MVEEEHTEVKEIQETYKIKGVDVTYSANLRVCSVCGEIVSDDELEDKSLEVGWETYRKGEKYV